MIVLKIFTKYIEILKSCLYYLFQLVKAVVSLAIVMGTGLIVLIDMINEPKKPVIEMNSKKTSDQNEPDK